MRTFFSKELGLNVITKQGDEVFLPDDNALVSMTYFEGAGLFEVMADGTRRSGQPLCVRTESVVDAFSELETPPAKSPSSKASASTTGEKYPQNSATAIEPLDAEATDDGETAPRVRSYKSLHRGWKNVRDKTLNIAEPQNTAFISPTLSGKVGFDRMSKLTAAFVPDLKNAFPTLKGNGAFFEPDRDGLGWHVHLFAPFREGIPAGFEEFVRDWWAHQEEIPTIGNDFQVEFRCFASVEQLIRELDYCNPTRGKKKGTMHLYPFGRQAARYYGKVSKPRTVTVPFRLIAELVSDEILSLRHSTEFTDPETGQIVYSRTRLIFNVGKSFTERLHERPRPDESDDLFRCRAFVAPPNGRCDECPLRSSCGWACRLCRNQGTELCAACKHGRFRSEQRCRLDGQWVLAGF